MTARKNASTVGTTLGGSTIGDAVALGGKKTVDLAMEVADLLSKALEIATRENSVGWVVAWLDAREDLGDFGHTRELQEKIEDLEVEKADLLEEIEDLKVEKADLLVVYPKGFPLDLSLSEQLQVEEFFRNLRDPSHLPRAEERLEGLLRRCRGFKVDQLEQVLQWMDSHALGELPFGPTEDLKRELEERKALAAEHEDQLHNLRGEVASYRRNARNWQRHEEKQATRLAEVQQALVDMSAEAGRLRLVLQDPRVAFTASHLEHLPLEALEWVVAQETAP